MPIYEYVCQSCDHRFEVKQKVNEPPVSACVRCGRAVTKVISAPAILFKGTGWYITDYSSKLKPPAQAEPAGQSPNGQKAKKQDAPASVPTTPAPASSASPASASSSGSSTTSPPASSSH